MYCSNCGKEIKEEAKFCYFCGVQIVRDAGADQEVKESVKDEKTTPTSEKQEKDVVQMAKISYEKIKKWLVALNQKERWLLATVVLLLVNPFLAMVDIFEFSGAFGMYAEKLSFFDYLNQLEMSLFIFLGIGAIIVAEFMMIYPWKKGKALRTKDILLTKVIAILALVGMLLMALFSSIAGALVKSELTFGGMLFIAESIALVVASFKVSAIIKKEVVAPVAGENSESISQ